MDQLNNKVYFEKLFYKVFHNKYLFNYIIHQIELNDWVEYDQCEKIHYSNKRKFKDIKSFDFIIKNKLESLLKSKLKSKDEYINYDIVDHYQFSQWINKLKDKKEMFTLILKSNSIDNKNKIISKLYQLNEELIDIAVNEPYSIPILLKLLYKSFKKSGIPQIKVLLDAYINNNNQDSICEILNFKNDIIFWIFENVEDIFKRDRILELVLSDSKYYNINSNNIISIKNILYNCISINTQIKLIKLKLVNVKGLEETTIQDLNKIVTNEDYNENFKILKNLFQLFKKNNKIVQHSKQLNFNSILLLYNDNLKLYLNNNKNNWKEIDEEIKEMEQELKIENFSLSFNKSMDFMKYYLSLEFQEENKYFILNILDNKIKRRINSSINSHTEIEKVLEIINFLPTSRITSEFCNIFKGITSEKEMLIVNNIETIDLISKYSLNFEQNTLIFPNFKILKYANVKLKLEKDLYKYSYILPLKNAIKSLNLKEIKEINEFKYIDDIFEIHPTHILDDNSIKPIPLESIEMEQLIEIIKYFISIDSLESIYYCLGFLSPINYYEKLFEDIKSAKFEFKIRYIYHYQFEQYEIETLFRNEIFILSINFLNPEKLEILLKNNINPILNTPDLLSTSLISIFKDTTDQFGKINFLDNYSVFSCDLYGQSTEIWKFNTITKISSKNIIDCIQLLFKYCDNQLLLNKEREEIGRFKKLKTIGKDIKCFNTIIFYLYKKLIQIKGISFKEIEPIYHLIDQTNYISKDFKNSTLFSIYYLSIKSFKFIKYIMELPFFSRFIIENNKFRYPISDLNNITESFYYSSNGIEQVDIEFFKISNYLNPSIFTFEFIFYNSSFDDILNKLIQDLSLNLLDHYHSLGYRNLINDLLNYNLIYLLNIRRIDLFLNNINTINQKKYKLHFQEFQFSEKLIKLCLYYGDNDIPIKELLKYPSKLKMANKFNIVQN